MSERKDAQRLDAAIADLLRGVPIESVLGRTDAELAPYLRMFSQLQSVQPVLEGPSEEFRMRLRARFVQGANRETRLDRGRGSRFQRAAVASAASLILGSALNPALAHELVTHVRETMGRAAADVLSAALFTERRGASSQALPNTPIGEESPSVPSQSQSQRSNASRQEELVPVSHATVGETGPANKVPGTTHGEPNAQPEPPNGVHSAEAPAQAPVVPGESRPVHANAPDENADAAPGGVDIPAGPKPPPHSTAMNEEGPSTQDTPREPTDERAQPYATDQPGEESSGSGFNPSDDSAASDGPPGLDGELPPGHGGPLPAGEEGHGGHGNGNGPPDHSAASDGPPGLDGELPPGLGGALPAVSQGNNGSGPPAHASASDGPPAQGQVAVEGGVPDVPEATANGKPPETIGPAERAQSNKPETAAPPKHARAKGQETPAHPTSSEMQGSEQSDGSQLESPTDPEEADSAV